MLHLDIKECLDSLYTRKKIKTFNVKDYSPWQLSHTQQMIFKDETGAQLEDLTGHYRLHVYTMMLLTEG